MTILERLAAFLQPPAPPALTVRQRTDGVYNYLTGLGGEYDKGQVSRPNPFHLPLSPSELENLYQYGGIARRIVDIVPQRACRRGWSVPDIGTEDSRLETWARVEEAMTWSRLYGAALALPVTIDDVPARYRSRGWLEQPLDLERVGAVSALHVFDGASITVAEWEDDITSPFFGRPRFWLITIDGFRAKIHASRLIHFRGHRRPPSLRRSGRNWLPDDSVLQAVWDELRRLSETLQGGAILASEIRESVLKIADYESRAMGDEADALHDRIGLIARAKSLLGMILLGPGDSYENRSNPPTGFDQLSAAGWEALAAVTGIPQVILMGSTPGGLNTDGESSWEGFRQLVSTYQESNRAELERLYRILYSAQDGPTGGVIPEDWAIEFAALDEPRESVIADTRAKVATIDAAMIAAGVYTADDVRRSRYSSKGWSIDLVSLVPVPATPAGTQGLEEGTVQDPGSTPAAPAVPDGYAAVAGYLRRMPQLRGDEADGIVILLPVGDPGMLDLVQSVLGTVVPEAEPHITSLYLGAGLSPEAVAEVFDAVEDAVEAAVVRPPSGPKVVAFETELGQPVPIVIEYTDAFDLHALHDRLLVALAHLVTTRQHPQYRPHTTIGYSSHPPTLDEVQALAELQPPSPVLSTVEVWVARTRVAAFTVRGA